MGDQEGHTHILQVPATDHTRDFGETAGIMEGGRYAKMLHVGSFMPVLLQVPAVWGDSVPSGSHFDPGWHLGVQDVCTNSHTAPSRIEVILKGSKTDPFCQGHTLHIGVTGRRICPVAALLTYLAARGANHGPLFVWMGSTS